jgi:hypothetical protein
MLFRHLFERKAKKKAQQKKNQYHQQIFQIVRGRQMEAARVKRLKKGLEPKAGKSSKKADDQLWSAKTATIRNRLTDKKRTSKERWNRFAGTSEAGGRGL